MVKHLRRARKAEAVSVVEDGKDEAGNLAKAITKAKMPKSAQEKCFAELKKLKSMSPMSAEATVVRNYLDWMVDLPWNNKSKVCLYDH